MTREEAIKLLVNATYSDEWQGNEDLTTAHNMAIKAIETLEEFEKAHIITGGRLNGRTYAYKCGLEDGKRKALEQEPCEAVVSRESLRNAFKNTEDAEHCKWTLAGILDEIDNADSVTPTRIETVTEFADRCRECGRQKKGKWIKNSWEICYTCTRCWKTNPSGTKYPYCPNCGAEMESEK